MMLVEMEIRGQPKLDIHVGVIPLNWWGIFLELFHMEEDDFGRDAFHYDLSSRVSALFLTCLAIITHHHEFTLWMIFLLTRFMN